MPSIEIPLLCLSGRFLFVFRGEKSKLASFLNSTYVRRTRKCIRFERSERELTKLSGYGCQACEDELRGNSAKCLYVIIISDLLIMLSSYLRRRTASNLYFPFPAIAISTRVHCDTKYFCSQSRRSAVRRFTLRNLRLWNDFLQQHRKKKALS